MSSSTTRDCAAWSTAEDHARKVLGGAKLYKRIDKKPEAPWVPWPCQSSVHIYMRV